MVNRRLNKEKEFILFFKMTRRADLFMLSEIPRTI